MNINLGAGRTEIPGYESWDIKNGHKAFPLDVADNSIETLRASHILEHFSAAETAAVLREWARALKPGGWLKVAVPDFGFVVAEYSKANPQNMPLAGYVMGGQQDDYDFHKTVFDMASLSTAMKAAGLVDVQLWKSEIADCASLPVSLNLMGRKPGMVDGKRHLWHTIQNSDASKCERCGDEASASWLARHSDDACQEKVVSSNGHTVDNRSHDTRFEAFVNSIEPKNTYSQFGEDGIIEAIFARIGTANKWCVECGAADGLFFSNTRRLIEQGWRSIQIEADDKVFQQLHGRYRDNGSVLPLNTRVGLQDGLRLDDVLTGAWNFFKVSGQIPTDFDLLVLDVDGQEYHIVNSLVKFKPRVLIVEYDPDADPMHIPEPGAPRLDQAGRFATRFAVEARGYEVICRTQCNLICVRRDFAHLLAEQTKEAPKAAPANGNGKVFVAGQWREIGTAPGQVQMDKIEVAPIGIATSTPRYGSLLAADTMWQVALALKAQPARSGGAWWEQGLTRQIEKLLEDGTSRGPVEFIMTFDFDSYMTPEDGIKLIQLMYENPQLDCIAPTQVRRGMFEQILAGTAGPVNTNDPLWPIIHGHFGFTIFRRRVFERLSTPWFLNVPDEQGRWGEGRVDADIYFWNKFCAEGFKAALSREVVIGHGDEGVCWPRINPDGSVTKVWQSVFEWIQTHKPPEGILKTQ